MHLQHIDISFFFTESQQLATPKDIGFISFYTAPNTHKFLPILPFSGWLLLFVYSLSDCAWFSQYDSAYLESAAALDEQSKRQEPLYTSSACI